MALACALRWQTELWSERTRFLDMPGPGAADLLLGTLNAPVGLARSKWVIDVPVISDWRIFILLVGALWHWVAACLECWRLNRNLLLPRGTLLRLVVDVLLISDGLLIFFLGGRELGHIRTFGWLWFGPALTFYLLWSFGLPLVFCCDVIRTLRPLIASRDRPQASTK